VLRGLDRKDLEYVRDILAASAEVAALPAPDGEPHDEPEDSGTDPVAS
jgi:hypothetical protein